MNNRPKIGLALSGGGARGLAHVGVIKVLEKENIPIDFIAGTSIGALVGGFYAALKNIKKIEEIIYQVNRKKFFSLIDPVLKGGFIYGKKIEKFLDDTIGQIIFEKLKIPFAAIAADLVTGKEIRLNSGKVAEAIRASISVPVVFKPYALDGKILVDGGLINPLPVDVVKEMGADKIIAVNLQISHYLGGKLNIFNLGARSMEVFQYHLAKERLKRADIVIEPTIPYTFISKFYKQKAVIKAGEEAALKEINKIKKLLE